MKSGKLRIGNKGEGNFIRIPFDEPETWDEFRQLYGDNEQFNTDVAMRGVRIRIQELTRPLVTEEKKKGTPDEQIQDLVLDWLQNNDITAKKERAKPGPRKPVEVVGEDKATYSNAELKAMLEKAGVVFKTAGQAA